MKLPHRRSFLHLAAGVGALPAITRIARAQTYPARPVAWWSDLPLARQLTLSPVW
jgi:hypothetical protein